MLEQLSFCDRINDLCRALQAMRRWGVPCERLEQFAHLHYVPEKDDALDDLVESFSSKAMSSMIYEAARVGAFNVIVGYLVNTAFSLLISPTEPAECPDWNDNRIRESALFLTGFITHLVLSR
ncbi:hypothetical protein JKP88DRAFT_289508 [Tribonema minus]|uniref:Uncharacterized protein n=1 Tax=Tribonema minus TaxID=303371 RepID=A0A836CH54_9STRA|nr:hypothetical protein JKP88DRAFT_289508 [Tribonema minus]